MRQVKIALIGAPGVGKSAFINVHAMGEFPTRPSVVGENATTSIGVFTTAGPLCLKITEIDVLDSKDMPTVQELQKYDAYILMFDLTSRVTFRNIPAIFRAGILEPKKQTRRREGEPNVFKLKPTVFVGSKADLEDERTIHPLDITYPG